MLSLYHVSRYSPLKMTKKMNGWNWNPTSTLADFHPSLGAWLSSEADQLHSTALRFLVPGQNPSGKRPRSRRFFLNAIKKTHQVSKFWRLARTKIVYSSGQSLRNHLSKKCADTPCFYLSCFAKMLVSISPVLKKK